jgi:hypothetical protein
MAERGNPGPKSSGQRTDEPGYVPDADMEPRREDARREGTLGMVLLVVLPVLILVTALAVWWDQIGLGGPAVDEPQLVGPQDEPTPDLPEDAPD